MSKRGNGNDRNLEKSALNRRNVLLAGTTLAAASALAPAVQTAQAQQETPPTPSGRKPNILFIMGDDIGWYNVSAYNMGVMGYRIRTAWWRPTDTSANC
jgi:hypothetical protein